MLRKIWLIAAQGFVLAAAALYLVDVYRPKPAPLSFRDAAGKAVPAVCAPPTEKSVP